MDESLKTKTVTVYDYGNNVALAERLSREFGTVNYFKPWKDTAPETLKIVVGDGLDTIRRIKNFFDPRIINGTDLFVFPDIYDGDLQCDLESRGKRVWGSRMAEDYEYKRELFATTLKDVGLEVSPYTVCVGVSELRAMLKRNDDLWIKVNMRGDGETWHHENYTLSKRKLDAEQYKYGPVGEFVRYTVCQSIDTIVESAYDGYCITSRDGVPQFPNIGFLGYEVKNQCHIAHAIPYGKFPEKVIAINEKFGPVVAKRNFRQAFGTEIKNTEDGKDYFLDFTARSPEPPGSLVLEQVKNLGEFMYHGADGDCRELEIEKPFAVQIMLYSSWSKGNWQTVEIPDGVRRWVKLYNYCFADGAFQVVPKAVNNTYSDGNDQIGAVVGIGDTIEEAIEEAKDHCDEVKGFDTDAQFDALAECLKRIESGEDEGIIFHADIPEPASAL